MAHHSSAPARPLGTLPRLAAPDPRILQAGAALGGAVLVWALTPFLEPAARITLGILVAASLLWITETVPLCITALFVLAAEIVLLGLPGRPLASVGARAFVASFFDPILVLFLGGFALGAAVQRSGLDRRLVRLALAAFPATPAGVLGGTLATTAFLSMWMSNTATAALMMAVVAPLAQQLGRRDPFRKALLLAVPFAANIGGIGTPIGTPPNVIALAAIERAGFRISFVKWMLLAVPIMVTLLAFTWWLLLRLFPPEGHTLTLDPGGSGTGPVTRAEVWTLAVFLLTAVGWLTSPWHGVPEYAVALLPIVLYFGSGLLPKERFGELGWDVLMLMGGGLSLGFALQSSGLAAWVAQHLPAGQTAIWLTLASAAALAVGVGTFISHTAAAAMLVPTVVALGTVHAAPLAIAVAIGVSGAMALPVSTPPNAIAFSSGALAVPDMAKAGIPVGVATVILVTAAMALAF